MSEEEKPSSTAVHFVSGVVAGCSGIIVGQPFDTIKVRLQTHGAYYKGAINCAKLTLQHEGIPGFFKGLTSPLIGSAWTNAIMFASYERTLRFIHDSVENPSLKSVAIAGGVSGVLQTVALCPAELIKCRLQVQDGHEFSHYNGPWDCAKHIYKRHGIRGLYMGYCSTISRELPAFTCYFTLYEASKRYMIDKDFNPHTSMLTAGGLAGVASWIISYPMDVIKSQIQTLPEDATKSERRMWFQARKLYQMGGPRIFVNGLSTAVVRAFPVNAVTFYFYEICSDMLHEYVYQD